MLLITPLGALALDHLVGELAERRNAPGGGLLGLPEADRVAAGPQHAGPLVPLDASCCQGHLREASKAHFPQLAATGEQIDPPPAKRVSCLGYGQVKACAVAVAPWL